MHRLVVVSLISIVLLEDDGRRLGG